MNVTARVRRATITMSLGGWLLLMTGCQTTDQPSNPPMTQSDRMSLQSECAKMADRSEREACLERATFDERW